MSAKLKRELELNVLSGGSANEYTKELLLRGLKLLRSIQTTNEAVIDATQKSRGKRSMVLRHRLPYGATLELSLRPKREMVELSERGFKVGALQVARIKTKAKTSYAVLSEDLLAQDLARRVADNPELLIGLVAALERGRRQLLAMIEESTRWLP